MRFLFYTLGCKVNRFETQALTQLAQGRGHEIVDRDADVVIINTCTVTSVSDHKNIRAFHKLRRENPHAVLAACGCFAQTAPEKVLAGGEIDLVCGTSDRAQILDRCEQAVQTKELPVSLPKAPTRMFEPLPAGVPDGRTRALLKVQDGCDNYCTYCIIPYARGHVRSMQPELVLRQVQELAAQSIREIVLAGIEISSYGQDFLEQKPTLLDLLEQVCAAAPQVRIRMSSLEPRTITEEFCRRMAKFPNFMPHFHLSLQSGCDAVLSRMKRRYTTAMFYENVLRLRRYFDRPAITTDVIVGFPEETAQEFADTMQFTEKCQFASMHVFPYSPRKGTVAADMTGQLPPQEKQHRAQQLKALAKQMEKAYLDSFIGQTMTVLPEHSKSPDWFPAHSPYHFRVKVLSPERFDGTLLSIQIAGRDADGLYGHLLSAADVQ